MLIIGHRGAAGLARENTMAALRAGLEAGADMLEFDVRLTKDNIPVLAHDFFTKPSRKGAAIIRHKTYNELAAFCKTHNQTITPLKQVLDAFFGKILLNIELKGKGSGHIIAAFIRNNYIKNQSDWENCIISSFRAKELSDVRAISLHANLALLHSENPFVFIGYHAKINFTAVGFHRLYVNQLAVETAKKLGIFTYAYTVNRPATAHTLFRKGIDGIVTDRPDIIAKSLI